MRFNRRTLVAGAALATLACLTSRTLADGVAKQEMPQEGIILVAVAKAKPGQEEALKQALMSMVEPTRKEPGCLCYNLHQSKSDKGQFMFYEQWASQEALDAHGKTPHMRALGAKLNGETAEGGGVTFYELVK